MLSYKARRPRRVFKMTDSFSNYFKKSRSPYGFHFHLFPRIFSLHFAVFSKKMFRKNPFFAISVSAYLVWTQWIVLRSYLVSFGFSLGSKKYVLQMWLCLFDRWVHSAFLLCVFCYFGFWWTILNSVPLLEWLCHLRNSDLKFWGAELLFFQYLWIWEE